MKVALGVELAIIVLAAAVFMWNHYRTVGSWRHSSNTQRQLGLMAVTAVLEAVSFLGILFNPPLPALVIEIVFLVVFGLIDAAWIGWVYLQWKARRALVKQDD
jgi:hypothetical protein